MCTNLILFSYNIFNLAKTLSLCPWIIYFFICAALQPHIFSVRWHKRRSRKRVFGNCPNSLDIFRSTNTQTNKVHIHHLHDKHTIVIAVTYICIYFWMNCFRLALLSNRIGFNSFFIVNYVCVVYTTYLDVLWYVLKMCVLPFHIVSRSNSN